MANSSELNLFFRNWSHLPPSNDLCLQKLSSFKGA